MRVFFCGGGSGNQTIEAYKKLNEVIDHNKPILYIPLAMNSERYDDCFEWICKELENVDIPSIKMVRSAYEITKENLFNYSAIFIGGGNTYKLLKELKSCEAFFKIKEYLDNDGIVFGGSAGAIILGDCIDTCKYADNNEVNLEDLMGFNTFNSFSFLCHFTNETLDKTELNRKYLLELSKEEKIIALPEEITLYYEDGYFEVLGSGSYYIFEEGNMIEYNSEKNRKDDYLSIKNVNELMEFMNNNITYGWLDKNGRKHLNNLKGFRENYHISSIKEILRSGLGTCIEQAKMTKSTFDMLGIESKLYCHRSYENEENFNKEVRMHCFLLFKEGDNWYHFEHSNRPKRGIHKYKNIDEAINSITSGYEENDIRLLTEIPDIPDGLTFMEFNGYVNQFNMDM